MWYVLRSFFFASINQFVCSMTTMNEKSFTFRKENAICVCDVHLCWASWIRYRVINNHQSHSNQIAHFELRHFTHTHTAHHHRCNLFCSNLQDFTYQKTNHIPSFQDPFTSIHKCKYYRWMYWNLKHFMFFMWSITVVMYM